MEQYTVKAMHQTLREDGTIQNEYPVILLLKHYPVGGLRIEEEQLNLDEWDHYKDY